jgi:transcriptional regulator with XRE-family HTH domain
MRQPEFGDRLRGLRKERGLTQRALAGDFVTPSYISLVEAGRREPTLDVVVHLAHVLDVPVNELLDDEGLALPEVRTRQYSAAFMSEIRARDSLDFDDYESAAESLTEALSAARADGQPQRVLDLGMRLQEVLRVIGRHDARVTLLEELAGMPLSEESPDLQVILASDLAAALRDAGRLPRARELAEAALDAIEETTLRRTTQHVKLLGVLVSILVESDVETGLRDRLEQLLDAADHVGRAAVKGRAHWVASRACVLLGDGDAAGAHLKEAQQNFATPTMPLRDWLRFCRSSAKVLLDIGGDLDQARGWLEAAESAAQALGLGSEQWRIRLLRARYEFARSEPARCLEILDPLLGSGEVAETERELLGLRFLQARANAMLGNSGEAERLLRAVAMDAEGLADYELAVQVWRQIDDLHDKTA